MEKVVEMNRTKLAYYEVYVFFSVHFHELLNKTQTKCTHVYFQLTHLHVSAQTSHLQGAELQNTNTLITVGPKYSHCISM